MGGNFALSRLFSRIQGYFAMSSIGRNIYLAAQQQRIPANNSAFLTSPLTGQARLDSTSASRTWTSQTRSQEAGSGVHRVTEHESLELMDHDG